MNIALAIIHLYPQANPMMDFIVQDDSDGNGPYIAQWNLTEPQPTEEELQAAWDSLQPTEQDVLSEYKQAKIGELYVLYNQELDVGFTSTIGGLEVNLSYSDTAQKRFNKQATELSLFPSIAEVQWGTKNQGFLTITRDDFINIVLVDASNHEKTLAFKVLYAEASIQNATSQEEVDTVVSSW